MSKIPYLIQGKNIILVIDGESHTISKDTHIAYGKIVDALKAEDWDTLRDLVSPARALTAFGQGYVTIENGKVYWKGKEFHNALSARMIEMFHEGFPIEPMVNFVENLMLNPSKRSVDQLYTFLERNKLPITQDGHFLAFKRVRPDYLDKHTGTIDNSIGQVVEMERNEVNDNPQETCSAGLHFCSEEYLGSYGSKHEPVMILKINPADVVSIPVDYNGSKGRCCRYEVVAQVQGEPSEAFASVVNGDYDSFDDEDFVEVSDDVDYHDAELYDLRRVNGNWVEYEGLTFEEARERVQKNIEQKKAKLKIVKAGTDEEIE